MLTLRLNVWNQSDGNMSYPWALSLGFTWYTKFQVLILNIFKYWFSISWRLKCLLSNGQKCFFFFLIKRHFLYCWRSGLTEVHFTFLHTISGAYMKGSYKPIILDYVKGFQGEVCYSVEIKDVASYHLFPILSQFWVSLEHEWKTQFTGILTFKWTKPWRFSMLTKKLGFFSIHVLLRHTLVSRKVWKDLQLYWNRNSHKI